MYLEFHHRDWMALATMVLKSSGHQRIHLKNVLAVESTHVIFVTTKAAHIVAPTFTTVHGHGIGFLSLLRIPHHDEPIAWHLGSGEPKHNTKLIVLNHHNFTPVLYPSLQQLKHWLFRQYQHEAHLYIEPFNGDINAGLIGEYPVVVDMQRQLSYPVI